MSDLSYTASGVRLRRVFAKAGSLAWLLLPEGPGIGSESLAELAQAMDVPGAIRLVDLPGDGSNRTPPGGPSDPLPVWPFSVVEAATARYEADPRGENVASVAVASAEWNFTPDGVEHGRELLGRMPYNAAAVAWSEACFDDVYRAKWWPRMPVLRLAGDRDRIVSQLTWDNPRFQTPKVLGHLIPDAGHFPRIENPGAVRLAFHDFAARLTRE